MTFKGDGIDRLKAMRNRLAISGAGLTGGTRHVFLDHFTSNHCFGHWCDSINNIQTKFIERICGKAASYGLNAAEAEAVAGFLKDRRADLRGILNRHHSQFTGIGVWELL